MKAASIVVAMAIALPAHAAAPFCVVTAYGKSCWYYQADQCQRDAAQQGGMCAVNTEVQRPQQQQQYQPRQQVSTEAPFCVVDAAGSRCWYYTADDCYRNAQNSQGACVINPNR